MHRVRVIATGVAGGPQYMNLYFAESAGTAAQAHAAVVTFVTAIAPRVHNLTQQVVTSEVAQVEAATGAVTGVANVPQFTIAGSNIGSPLPSATQGLLRLLTGTYLGGRQIRGRTYIWFPTNQEIADGGTTSSYRSAINAAAAALVSSAAADLVVWSRKNGVAVPVTTAQTWVEWAVQRSRRD